jgi:hypothetical protein
MVRHRHIAAVVAIAVGLTPSLASIVSAYPAPLAQAEATSATTQNNVPARPTSLVPGDSPTAIGYSGPVSQPSSPPGDSPTAIGYSGPVSQPSPAPQRSIPALLYSGTGTTAPTAAAGPHTVVRVVASHDGFDWGDAGIGAGAMLLLLGMAIAGTLVATNGRRGHIHEQRAVATN